MPHVIERARSGRAKCRGCGRPIPSGDWRLGERVPNAFADEGSETTLWYHPTCGALMRPEPFLDALAGSTDGLPDREWLEREARLGVVHRRLPRAATVARAPSGRAACRACREPIAKDEWRIALKYYEDGRFVASGFIHLRCAARYFETTDLIDRLRYLSPELSASDIEEIRARLAGSAAP